MTKKPKPLKFPITFVQGSVGQIIAQTNECGSQTALTKKQVNDLGGILVFRNVPFFDEDKFNKFYLDPGRGEKRLLIILEHGHLV